MSTTFLRKTSSTPIDSIDHDEAVIDMLRADPDFAAEYLNAVLDEGDQQELMLAMRRVAEAFGGVAEIARRSQLHAKTLYRTLSAQGNPELKSLSALLKSMGLRISVTPLRPKGRTARRRRSTL